MRLSKLNEIKAILSCCAVYKVVKVDSAEFGKLFSLRNTQCFWRLLCPRSFKCQFEDICRILALKKTAIML